VMSARNAFKSQRSLLCTGAAGGGRQRRPRSRGSCQRVPPAAVHGLQSGTELNARRDFARVGRVVSAVDVPRSSPGSPPPGPQPPSRLVLRGRRHEISSTQGFPQRLELRQWCTLIVPRRRFRRARHAHRSPLWPGAGFYFPWLGHRPR
jgi:hypothetical protein